MDFVKGDRFHVYMYLLPPFDVCLVDREVSCWPWSDEKMK